MRAPIVSLPKLFNLVPILSIFAVGFQFSQSLTQEASGYAIDCEHPGSETCVTSNGWMGCVGSNGSSLIVKTTCHPSGASAIQSFLTYNPFELRW